jgi:hypothetical protein
MKYERTFELETTAKEAEKRAEEFLAQAGYERISTSELKYKRGSMLGSLTSFSPRKSRASLLTRIHPLDSDRATVSVTLDVNTTGQIVTQRDIDYWETEIEGFKKTIESGNFSFENLNEDHQKIIKSGWKGFWIFLVVTFAVGFPIGVIASMLNPAFSNIGIVAGVTAGMAAARKHWGF